MGLARQSVLCGTHLLGGSDHYGPVPYRMQGDSLKRAYRNLTEGRMNTGLTYSDYRRRETVMVISLTSTPEEFQNSWDHEKGHLCRHISKAFGIDPYGEEAQYLSGYVGQKMFPVAKKFLCEHCRKGLEK